jgi:hypothetical protein
VIAREGEYAFSISADDNGWIRIDGRDVIADVGELMKPEASGTISLSAGTHQIEIGERNIVGDASVHVEWQPPDAPPQPLPTSVLVPSPP